MSANQTNEVATILPGSTCHRPAPDAATNYWRDESLGFEIFSSTEKASAHSVNEDRVVLIPSFTEILGVQVPELVIGVIDEVSQKLSLSPGAIGEFIEHELRKYHGLYRNEQLLRYLHAKARRFCWMSGGEGGASVAIAFVRPGGIEIGLVGDCRIGLLRATRWYRPASGALLIAPQTDEHGRLLQAVGNTCTSPAIGTVQMDRGDILVLSSDGMIPDIGPAAWARMCRSVNASNISLRSLGQQISDYSRSAIMIKDDSSIVLIRRLQPR